MKRAVILTSIFCFLLPFLCGAQAYKTESGYVEFQSEVPLHSFTGTSRHLVGKINLQDSTVDFYLDLNTLDTGNNKRDKDMRETLESEKYPFAEFYGKLVENFDPAVNTEQKVTVKGEFKIHNVTKVLKLEGILQKQGGGIQITADWTLNMTDYNVKPPGILFYRVEEEIDISIQATLEPVNN